jgi:hypothetical protein
LEPFFINYEQKRDFVRFGTRLNLERLYDIGYLIGILVRMTPSGHLEAHYGDCRLSLATGTAISDSYWVLFSSGWLRRCSLYSRLNCPTDCDILIWSGTLFQLSATLTMKKLLRTYSFAPVSPHSAALSSASLLLHPLLPF